MPHHLECWIENGQCTTYGCRGYRLVKPPILPHRRQINPPIVITHEDLGMSISGKWQQKYGKPAALVIAAIAGGGLFLLKYL
jgi:hypothetical protein